MALAKGTVYLSMKTYVEKTHGKEGVDQVLAALSPQDQEALRSVLPIGMYPIEPALRFEEAADRLLGKGDQSYCFDMGLHAAEWHLNTFHKVFLRFANPTFLVGKGGELWRHYHDSGRMAMDPPTPGMIRAHLTEFNVADAAFCTNLQGWMTRAIELTGARDVKLSHPVCRARGGTECEFVATYVDK